MAVMHFLRHMFMHSCVDLSTLQELFGRSSQCTGASSSADVPTMSLVLFKILQDIILLDRSATNFKIKNKSDASYALQTSLR